MYGLKATDIHKVRSVLEQFRMVEKAVIYGSRALGNFKNGYDIDLTLYGENLDLSTLFQIENQLDDLLLPYFIDLSIFDRIENAQLKDHIFRNGKSFYERQ